MKHKLIHDIQVKMEATSRLLFVAAGIVPVIRGSVEEKVGRNGRSGEE